MTPAPGSRYFGLPTAELTTADGRTVVYLLRRFLPPVPPDAAVVEAAVRPGDRLDVLTARHLGDPELFWKVADANRVPNPAALVPPGGTAADGRPVRLRVPRIGG